MSGGSGERAKGRELCVVCTESRRIDVFFPKGPLSHRGRDEWQGGQKENDKGNKRERERVEFEKVTSHW